MTISSLKRPVAVFLSYSHKDEDLRNALVEHLAALQRENWITVWHDRRITAGDEWKDKIDEHLLAAQIILLLVSPSFIASDYCYGLELTVALKRRAEEGVLVIPIVLRPVDWELTPFGQLQALPKDARPVTEWADQDAALRDVATAIRQRIDPNYKALPVTAAATAGWERATERIRARRWSVPIVVAVLLTFGSRVFFSVALPTAPPLGGRATLVIFAFWTGLCFGGRHIADVLHRRVTARRKVRTPPNSTDVDTPL